MKHLKIDLPDELWMHYHHKDGCVNLPADAKAMFVGTPFMIVTVDDEMYEEMKTKFPEKFELADVEMIKQAMNNEAKVREKLA